MSEAPLFSIITVCKNAGLDLERTIDSIKAQTFKNYEYILVDGNSDDQITRALINSNKSFFTKIVIESDSGIYDAMNKGVKEAGGDYINFLNAGDLFNDAGVLQDINDHLKTMNVDIIYGDVMVFGDDVSNNYVLSYNNYDLVNLLRRPINHQSLFASRRLFEKNGLFDTAFRIRGDHDWELRNFKDKELSSFYLPRLVANYKMEGFTSKNKIRYGIDERKLLIRKNISFLGIWLYRLFSIGSLIDRSVMVRKLMNFVFMKT